MLDILEKIMINFVKGKTETLLTDYNTFPSQCILTETSTNIPILTTQERIVLKTSISSYLPNPLNCFWPAFHDFYSLGLDGTPQSQVFSCLIKRSSETFHTTPQ